MLPATVGSYQQTAPDATGYQSGYVREGAVIQVLYSESGDLSLGTADLAEPEQAGAWTCGISSAADNLMCVAQAYSGFVRLIGDRERGRDMLIEFGDQLLLDWK